MMDKLLAAVSGASAEIIRTNFLMKNLTRDLVATALIVLSMAITGCATVPSASPEFERKATSFTPPVGMAAIYVYRPYHLVGSAVHFRVSLDYKDFGTVVTDTYLFAAVKPGEHVIKAAGGIPLSVASITSNVEAGGLYFFKVSPGWSQIEIKQIDERVGREELNNLRLSGDNAFEFSGNAAK
jgi:hypothetical protein